MSLNKGSIVEIFTTIVENLFILDQFKPKSVKDGFLTAALGFIVHLQFNTHLIWIDYKTFHGDSIWVSLLLGIFSLLIEFSSEFIIFGKLTQKSKRMLSCISRLLNMILMQVFYIYEMGKILRDSRVGKDQTIFNLEANFLLSIINLCFGYLRWPYMVTVFLFTFIIISGMGIANTGIITRRSESVDDLVYSDEGFLISSFISIIISIIIVTVLIRKRNIALDSINKILSDSSFGKAILSSKKNEIIFTNDNLYQITGKRGNEFCFEDLESLQFNLFHKHPEHRSMLMPNSEIISPMSGRSLQRRKIGLTQILEHLKNNPKETLKVYLRIELSKRECIIRKYNKKGGRVNIEPVSSILDTDGNFESEAHQYEVKFSFLNWNYYKDKYIFIQFNDITDLQKIIDAQRHIDFKTKILHSFSHELRTPINISRNMIDLMIMDEHLPEQIKDRYASVILESINQLDLLIQDIIDFLKIESSQFQLMLSQFSLREVTEEVLNIISNRIKGHEIQIYFDCEENEEYIVFTDRTRLKRVLLNILFYLITLNSNCSLHILIKESSFGCCDFSLRMCSQGKEPVSQSLLSELPKQSLMKSLSVQHDNDFGITISKILLTKLKNNGIVSYNIDYEQKEGYVLKFVATSNLNGSPNQLNEPSIINMAKMEVGSVTEMTFARKERKSFTMPSGKKYQDVILKHIDIANSIANVSEYTKPCPRVLIVDDDQFNLLSINLLLEKLNLFSIKATNGLEAISNLTKYQKEHNCVRESCKGIEIILLDLMMPVMNGLECATALIKMMDKGVIPTIPIIACTANDSKDIVESCQKIGFKEILSKPIIFDTLRKTVQLFLD